MKKPAAIYRPKVYTASKLRHAQLWRDMRLGRLHFCDFTASWIDVPDITNTDISCSPDVLRAAWTLNIKEVMASEFLLVYCPHDDETILQGVLVEVGASLASGGHVIFVGDTTGTWVAHPRVLQVRWFDDAISFLWRYTSTPPRRTKLHDMSVDPRTYEGK